MPTYAGYENTWCGGGSYYTSPPGKLQGYDSLGLPVIVWEINDTTLSFEASLCTLQGAIIQFGFLAAVFWWVIIAFNMCLEVRKKPPARFHYCRPGLTFVFFFCLISSTWDSTSALISQFGSGYDLESISSTVGEYHSYLW